MYKKVDTSGLDPVTVNQPTLERHRRMRGMSKKRDVNKSVIVGRKVHLVFSKMLDYQPKRVGLHNIIR